MRTKYLYTVVALVSLSLFMGAPSQVNAQTYCVPGYLDSNCVPRPVPGPTVGEITETNNKTEGSACMYDTECGSGSCSWFRCEAETSVVAAESVQGSSGQPTISRGGGIDIYYLKGYADQITFIINRLIVPVLMAVAFLYFLWGIANTYIIHPDKPSEGHTMVLWSVIGFAVIFSIWGLVNLAVDIFGFGLGGSNAPRPPTF